MRGVLHLNDDFILDAVSSSEVMPKDIYLTAQEL